MDNYRLPDLLIPEDLYRVDYLGSRTTYSETEGLVAADRFKVYNPQDIDAFKNDIVKHFTWPNREPLPFISLFSDLYHAANWGLKQPWKDYTTHCLSAEWAVRAVKTKLLVEPCIFKLEDLVHDLKLRLPDKALQHIEGAYICLHNVPAAAIYAHWNPQQAKQERDCEYEARKIHEKEKWDYLDGNYDSQDGYLQENWNTIIEKELDKVPGIGG